MGVENRVTSTRNALDWRLHAGIIVSVFAIGFLGSVLGHDRWPLFAILPVVAVAGMFGTLWFGRVPITKMAGLGVVLFAVAMAVVLYLYYL